MRRNPGSRTLDPRDFRRAFLRLLNTTERKYVAARIRVSKSAVDKWASGAAQPSKEHFETLRETYPGWF